MKIVRSIFLPLLLLLLTACKQDDAPGESGVFLRQYGTAGDDYGNALVETSDRGFAIAGGQYNDENGQDIVLLRTDADGNLVWRKLFGGIGDDSAEDLLLLDDGGFLIVGWTSSGAFGESDVWLLRTDAQGELLWSKTYGGEGDDVAIAAHILPDGGYAVVGSTESVTLGASAVASQFYLLSVNTQGDTLWTRSLGGHSEDRAYSVDIAADGSWVVGGIGYDDVLDYQAQVMRLDAHGNSLWANSYLGISARDDRARAVLALPNGNIAWLGYTYINRNDYNLVIRILDSTGQEYPQLQWFIGGADDEGTLARHFLQLSDSTFVFPAFTKSKGKGANDMYLVGAGPDKRLTLDATFGGDNDDFAVAIVATDDGGYAMVGYTKSFNFNDTYDIVLLKTDGTGGLVVH